MPIRTAYLIYGVCCFLFLPNGVCDKKTENRYQKPENRNQKTENGYQKADIREQTPEDKKQETEIRNQKTGNRKRKSDIEAVGCHLPGSE